MVMDVGAIVMKTAGRDAGSRGVILEVEGNMALVDGETRRRKTNLAHLEPTGQKVQVKKGATHEEVKKILESLKITVRDTKPKKAATRPKKVRQPKEKPAETKEDKKAAKEEAKAEKKKKEKPVEKKESKAAEKPAPKKE